MLLYRMLIESPDAAPSTPPSDLVATLRRCCDNLKNSLDDTETQLPRLAARRRGLAVVDVFRQVLEQAPVAAVGADFVAAAAWLAGFYAKNHDEIKSQLGGGTSGLLLSADGKSNHDQAAPLLDDLARRAMQWDEVVTACGASEKTAQAVGMVRIFTNVAAATATLVTSGRVRGNEARALTDVMVSTIREAAAMANLLGGDGEAS